MAKHAAIVLQ